MDRDDGWGLRDAGIGNVQVIDLETDLEVAQDVQVGSVVETLGEFVVFTGQMWDMNRRQVAQEIWHEVRAQSVEETLENHQLCRLVLDERVCFSNLRIFYLWLGCLDC